RNASSLSEAAAPLLDAGGSDALQQVALTEQEDYEQWNQRNNRHREHAAPVRGRRGIEEVAQGQGNREVLVRGEVDQLREEVVPGPNEGENRGGRQGGNHQREDDAAIDAEVAGAVDAGSLVQLARQRPYE